MPPTIITPHEGQIFRTSERRDITLTCVATGKPKPVVTFQYEGRTRVDSGSDSDGVIQGRSLAREIIPSSSGVVETETFHFTLFSLTADDSGNLSCAGWIQTQEHGVISGHVTFMLLVLGENQPPVETVVWKYSSTPP